VRIYPVLVDFRPEVVQIQIIFPTKKVIIGFIAMKRLPSVGMDGLGK
jgi:hypothetical protein